jgi:hypothetical protein
MLLYSLYSNYRWHVPRHIYIAVIRDNYPGSYIDIIRGTIGGSYIASMDQYEGPHTDLTITLH